MDIIWGTAPGLGARKCGDLEGARGNIILRTFLLQRLSDLADDVFADKVDKGVGAVASQILNVYVRAVSVELKAREQLELIERVEDLEGALERQKESHRYGA